MPNSPGEDVLVAPKRTRLSAEERRRQIVDSARQVFAAHGLAGARTRDIAAAAGINEAMLYRHFGSKDELYEAAVGGPLEAAIAALVEASGAPPEEFDVGGETMHERTEGFVRDLLVAMEEIAPLLGVALFGEATASAAYFSDRVAPALASIRRVVEANLESWSHRDFDVRLTVEVVFGACWFHATAARLEGRTVDVDQVAHRITSLILDGLVLPG